MEEFKRVYAVTDYSGHWYIIPFDLKEEFDLLLSESSAEYDEDEERNSQIESAEIEFEQKFSQYMTGGDINLTELYIKE